MARGCTQCGAAVEVPSGVFSTSCPFCDSPLVEVEAAQSAIDAVVPFVITKAQAARLLREHLAAAWLAPESVRRVARAEELDAVLLPFTAVDACTRSTYSATIGVDWYRTETYTTTENGKTVVRTRQVRETEWFPLSGEHGRRWFDHLVSASRGLPEAEANALEPYDLGRALPFDPALTAGVLAELPSVSADEQRKVLADELSQRAARDIERSLLPGDRSSQLHVSTRSDVERSRTVLLPVWIAAVAGPKGPLRVLVNGQTGEVVGDLPRSWWKIAALVVVALLVGFAVVSCVLGCGAVMGALR